MDRQQRVTERAEKLWREAGSPAQGPNAYRDLASELIAIEDNQHLTLKPVHQPGPYGEPVEPAEPVENLGEFPTLTDEGDQQYPPDVRNEEPEK
ncbi:MAG: hypothetical protein AB7O56_03200 [Bauldia sp.]